MLMIDVVTTDHASELLFIVCLCNCVCRCVQLMPDLCVQLTMLHVIVIVMLSYTTMFIVSSCVPLCESHFPDYYTTSTLEGFAPGRTSQPKADKGTHSQYRTVHFSYHHN